MPGPTITINDLFSYSHLLYSLKLNNKNIEIQMLNFTFRMRWPKNNS